MPSIFQICIYSRDKPLTSYNVLHEEAFAAPIVLLSIYDSSLLVYTSDNTLTHFLITTTPNGRAALRLCGSIGFEGVIRDPLRVRGMSWLLPPTQHSAQASILIFCPASNTIDRSSGRSRR